jgi:hypothetical protein
MIDKAEAKIYCGLLKGTYEIYENGTKQSFFHEDGGVSKTKTKKTIFRHAKHKYSPGPWSRF